MADALRVLIADEDLDSRVAARKAVQRANLGLAGESGFGTEAVSLALEARPDAILVSVEEPASRPLQTAEALANALPDTPILIYSSLADVEAVRRGMVFGARDYLVKPLQAARLRDAVMTALLQEERRQMRRAGQVAVGGRGTVITVTGAKGGIGKTVVSVNLAVALRQETGRSVVLVDADTQFGDVATMLDLSPVVTVADLLRSVDTADRSTVRDFVTTHPVGVDVAAGPHDSEEWTSFDGVALTGAIDLLAQVFEFVVVDTSGSFDAPVRACIEASTLALIVTTGDVSSVRDTAAAFRRLVTWGIDGDRTRMVFNRGARSPGIGSAELKQATGHPVFWEFPYDRGVPLSIQTGQPLMLRPNRTPFAQSMAAMARRIAGAGDSRPEPEARSASWRRVFHKRGESHDPALAPARQVGDIQ